MVRKAVKKDIVNEKVKEYVDIIEDLNKFDEKEPTNIKVDLFPYQKVGFNWIMKMYNAKIGGILADDMGLGKTLQIICFINEIMQKNDKKVLIIAPTSLVNNWKEEFYKFCDIEPIMIYNFTKEKTKKFFETYNKGVLITSYDKAANNIKTLEEINFDVCIADETQKIKNNASKTKTRLKKIPAEVKFALTGTPIENSVNDLWSIFDFVFKDYLFNERKFKQQYSVIYNDANPEDFYYNELEIKTKIAQEDLKKKIKPFILRRKKEVELSKILKNKNVIEIPIKLNEIEKSIYFKKAEEKLEQMKKNKERIEREASESEDIEDIEEIKRKNGLLIFKMIQELKAITSLPGNILYNGKPYNDITKLKVYKELMEKLISQGDRVLVFSSYLTLLDISEKFLQEKSIKYFRIDGSTKPIDRQNITKDFNNNEEYKVVLISLKAGSSGLNLVGANKIVHYDLWWNPSVENQANDRAYRIGQTRDVEIYKLICLGTIEEKILNLQKKKQNLFDLIIEKDEFVQYNKKSNIKELEELFT